MAGVTNNNILKEKIDNIKIIIKKNLINREVLQWIPIFIILIVLVIPFFIFLFVNFFYEGNEIGQLILSFNLYNLLRSFFEEGRSIVISNTFTISYYASIIATILGYVLSYFVFFLRSPKKKLITAIIYFPLFFNSIIQFHAIESFFINNGILNSFLLNIHLINSPIIFSETFITILSLVFRYISISFFFTSILMKLVDTSQIEAAIDLGANGIKIFYDFILKNTYQSMIASIGIIFILCYGNIPSFLLTNIQSFSSHFINLLFEGHYLDASAYFFLFGVLTCFAIFLYNIFFDKSKCFSSREKFGKLSKYKCLKVAKSPFVLVISIGTVLLISIVFLSYFILSFNQYDSVSSLKGFSLKWYKILFSNINLLYAVKNTFIVSCIVSCIVTILGTMFTISFSKYRQLLQTKFIRFIKLPFLFSDVVFCASSITIIKFASIHNLLTTQIIGLSIPALFISILLIYRSIQTFDLNMEGASLDLGSDYIKTFKYIILPALLPAIRSTFLIIFVYVFNEFTVSFFLTPGVELPLISNSLMWLIQYNNSPLINAYSTLILFLSVSLLNFAISNNNYDKHKENIKRYTIFFIILFTVLFIILS